MKTNEHMHELIKDSFKKVNSTSINQALTSNYFRNKNIIYWLACKYRQPQQQNIYISMSK